VQGDFEDFLVSGKSEDGLKDHVTEEPTGTPLAMWETEIQDIELEKGESGLGFSILDYQVRKLEDLHTLSTHLSRPTLLKCVLCKMSN